jgi:hypothetical protein
MPPRSPAATLGSTKEVRTMIIEAHQTESCWTIAHSLRNCEGYHVFEGIAWLGYVDTVLADGEDVHALLVSAGDGGDGYIHLVAVPVEAVVEIDPAGERIDLAERDHARSLMTKEVAA